MYRIIAKHKLLNWIDKTIPFDEVGKTLKELFDLGYTNIEIKRIEN